MDLARIWGTRLAIGMALHAQALVEGGDQQIDLLCDAVATLEGADAQLEHAKALVDLGAALRRAGRTRDARDRLAAGMDLAHTCGAMALLDRARDELIVAGARPRNSMSQLRRASLDRGQNGRCKARSRTRNYQENTICAARRG